jgi:putative two-component system response regulator
VADVYDALLSARPYRAQWSEEMAQSHIKGLSGVHFDPEVVRQFLALLGKG